MKILKIAIILLVPAIGIVGCKKTEIKPVSPQSTAAAPVTNPDNTQVNARIVDPNDGPSIEEPNSNSGTTIVGSGDDDRDGGDKRKKSAVK